MIEKKALTKLFSLINILQVASYQEHRPDWMAYEPESSVVQSYLTAFTFAF